MNLPRTIAEACRNAATLSPAKPFLVGPEPLSYGALLERMARLTAFFAASGLCQGDRVIIACKSDTEAVVLFLSLLCNGLTAVMIDPLAPAAEANVVITAAEPRGMFIDADLHEAWQPAAAVCTVLIRAIPRSSLYSRLMGKKQAAPAGAQSYPALLEHHGPAAGPETVSPDTDAYIMFTSGTTALPKGVRISQKSLACHLGTLTRTFGYTERSRILNILPLHHADGMIQGPVAAFFNGAAIYRPMPFSIQALPPLLDTVYSERVTHFVAVPTMLALILKIARDYEDSFSSPEFRFVISTAAYLDQSLWERFESRFNVRIANVYGLTETVAGSFFSGPGDGTHRPGTVGKPVDCLARIVADDGTDLPPGETGELLLAGDHLLSGYFNDPAATAEAMEGGWLRTGDLAMQDGEGFFRIVGRKKNLIISGGFNIQPEEVTACLSAHPAVREAVTFGLADAVWGEQVVSCAVLTGDLPLSDEILTDYLRGRLAPYKVPARIHFMAELPRGPSGKVIIDRVRELAGSASGGGTVPLAGGIGERILDLAARCFRMPASALSLDARQASTAGWDSLAHLELIVALEQGFGISLTAADIIRIESLRDAERIVTERSRG
jgi:long-chain acyl-CoA synthetase